MLPQNMHICVISGAEEPINRNRIKISVFLGEKKPQKR